MATELKRELDFHTLLLLGINGTIGTGIYFVPGIAAAIAGPASILSWIAVGVIAIFIALYFAELSSMFPKSGGVYEYTKNAFGNFFGYMVGWTGWVVANITIAMLVLGSIDYLSAIIPISAFQKIIFALLFILFVNYISYNGVGMGVKIILLFAVITIMVLWFILSIGLYHSTVSNFHPFFALGTLPVFIAMLFILETFFGWETVSYLAEESKDPKKNLPKTMIYSTLFIVALALGVVAVALSVVPWETLANSASPLATTVSMFAGNTGKIIITIGIFINILGTAAAWIIATPRLIFALSRDRLLPRALSEVHGKYGTPHNAIMFQAVLSSFIVISGSYLFLLKVLLPLAIFMYAMVLLSVTKLRFSKPELERGFRAPLAKVVPIMIAIVMFVLAAYIKADVILAGALFVLMGLPIYIITKLRDSETFPKLFYSILSKFPGYDTLSRTSYAKEVSKRMIHGIPLKGKILEVDCKTALFLRDTAGVGDTELRVGTDLSFTPLTRAKKRTSASFVNADTTDLPFKSNSFDYVFCMGLSPEVVDLDSFIREVIRVLKPQGRARILAFAQVLGFEAFFSPNLLKNIAEKYGYRATIERERYGGVDYHFITLYPYEDF